jgi:23S rRNA (guanosine2251-2'-O)-methyltransferase
VSNGDRIVAVYGRMPVLEALADSATTVELVLLARTARGDTVDDIVRLAGERGVTLKRVAPEKVTRVSGNGRHDQGVVAEVAAPGVTELDHWLADHRPTALLLLDGVTNPANVGMIVRTVTAAGLDGLVLPRAGSPDVGPLVVKASAGVAFRATILSAPTAADAVASLFSAGIEVVGLRADAPDLFTSSLPSPAAWVLGGEHDGISPEVARRIDAWRSLPLANGVESLNVAVTAGIVAYEVARRRA